MKVHPSLYAYSQKYTISELIRILYGIVRVKKYGYNYFSSMQDHLFLPEILYNLIERRKVLFRYCGIDCCARTVCTLLQMVGF